MKYVIIGICIVTVAVIVAFLVYRKKKSSCPEGITEQDDGAQITKQRNDLSQTDKNPDEFVVRMEKLPAEAVPDEKKLVEITDSKVLARVNSLIPGLAQAGNAVSNAVQTNGEVLYRAILPAGAKLSRSHTLEGAVKEMYHGANGIKGHADWLPVEIKNGRAMAAAMGVASMIVGQYYMTQINAELGEISEGISKVVDFQNNEFRSRVFSLVTHVKEITDFQVEILENDELRLLKITQLDSLQKECTELLGQTNLTLVDFSKENGLDYAAYEKELNEAQNWYMY